MLSTPIDRKARTTRSACTSGPDRAVAAGGAVPQQAEHQQGHDDPGQLGPVADQQVGAGPPAQQDLHGEGQGPGEGPGSTSSGANCPPRKVNSEKKTVLSAETLVSQKAERATHHSTTNRSTMARTSAGRKARTAAGLVPLRSASKTTARTTAAGSTPTRPTSL